MKISEAQNEEALELLADILEPASVIFTDEKFKNMLVNNQNKMQIITYLLKNHKKSIIEIMAGMEGVPVDEYTCTVVSLTRNLLELLNDKELESFFQS